MALLRALGFKVNPHFHFCRDIEAVIAYWQTWQGKREREDYGIDGLAVKINEREFQTALGYTGKAPRFAIAFKFPAEETTTVVEKIIFQVGRTGIVTPVAKLRPVRLAGSRVARATLHNEDEIKRLDLRLGDTVIVRKAGDIIPEIIGVLKELRTGQEKKFRWPTYLAEADSRLERRPGEAAYRLVKKNSAAQQRRRLHHFTSKSAFNIDGLGRKMIDLLLEHKLLASYPDIFSLTYKDLIKLPRLADKSVKNLLVSINRARVVTLPRLLVALSVDGVGEETAELLAREFRALTKIQSADRAEFEAIAGIGPVVARSIYDWFHAPANQLMLKNLLTQIKIQPVEATPPANNKSKFVGKTFVFTGTLPTLTRVAAKRLVKNAGGRVAETISGKTDFLVAGRPPRLASSTPGEKLVKAEKFEVKIIDETEFLRLLKS